MVFVALQNGEKGAFLDHLTNCHIRVKVDGKSCSLCNFHCSCWACSRSLTLSHWRKYVECFFAFHHVPHTRHWRRVPTSQYVAASSLRRAALSE
jgi:hypothetical protein